MVVGRDPVHLDGVYWERHPVQYSIQESRGRVRGSPGVGLHHVPAGHHVPGGEVLQHHAGERPHVQSVHLDQVPGFLYGIPFGLASRVGTPPQPWAGREGAAPGRPEVQRVDILRPPMIQALGDQWCDFRQIQPGGIRGHSFGVATTPWVHHTDAQQPAASWHPRRIKQHELSGLQEKKACGLACRGGLASAHHVDAHRRPVAIVDGRRVEAPDLPGCASGESMAHAARFLSAPAVP